MRKPRQPLWDAGDGVLDGGVVRSALLVDETVRERV